MGLLITSLVFNVVAFVAITANAVMLWQKKRNQKFNG